MRNVLIIGMLLAMLIVGILVVKNMNSQSGGNMSETQKIESMEKAKETAAQAQDKLDQMQNTVNDLNKKLETP